MNKNRIYLVIVAALVCASAMHADGVDFLKKFKKNSTPEPEAVEEPAPDNTADVIAQPSDPVGQLDGSWLIYELRGDRVHGDERPYLDIQLSSGRFYGSNGCNVINGTVKADRRNITFSDLISTRRLCSDVPDEYLINTTLEAVSRYTVRRDGHEYYLDLADASGRTLMVFRKHNMDFLNGAWRVVSVDGERNRNEGVEIVIDIAEARIHGNTGCNILNGSLFIDPDKSNSIQFQQIVTTRAACPDGANETAFLVSLEEVESAYAEGRDAVVMFDGHGREVIRLQRLSDPDSDSE